MAEIIKTQLHPDGDKYTVLHPETSVEQVVGFNDKVAEIIGNSVEPILEPIVESKIPSYYVHNVSIESTSYFIFFTIITNSSAHLSFGDVAKYVNKCVTVTCNGVIYNPPDRRAVIARGSGSNTSILVSYGDGNISIHIENSITKDNPVKL